MAKAERVICLTIAVVLGMLGASNPSNAQVAIDIQVLADPPGCRIQTVGANERYRGVCRGGTQAGKCDGSSFSWSVLGGNSCKAQQPTWELFIVDAPAHIRCFEPDPALGPGVVQKFVADGPTTLNSGPPSVSCSQDKYGTYWPYIIVLEDGNGNQLDSTDPGAVIFP